MKSNFFVFNRMMYKFTKSRLITHETNKKKFKCTDYCDGISEQKQTDKMFINNS